MSRTKRSTAIGSTTGAPTTWCGATILPRIVAWARNSRRSRTRHATHMQLWLPLPPLANLSGLISLQICIATWQTNDSSDRHGLGGPLSGSCLWPRCLSTMDIKYSPMPPYASTTLPGMSQLSLQGHHCPTSSTLVLVSPTTPCLTFPHETSQEKALRKITFARKQGSVTKSLSHMITHGAHLPPPVGVPWLQGWLSSQVLFSWPSSYVPKSRHSPTDCISVQEGAIQASSNNAFRHQLLHHCCQLLRFSYYGNLTGPV